MHARTQRRRIIYSYIHRNRRVHAAELPRKSQYWNRRHLAPGRHHGLASDYGRELGTLEVNVSAGLGRHPSSGNDAPQRP